MASLPLSRVTPTHVSSSDSEASDSDANSAMLASCSLQEIRQEDLAAILPDQQDCDAFGGFEYESRPDKSVPEVGDASGSDMELPTQLVNAAIQRVTESSSETESQPPSYASTLLQQFVQQTQLLIHAPSSNVLSGVADPPVGVSGPLVENHSDNVKNESVKRKRGRPRKNVLKVEGAEANSQNSLLNPEYCGEANVSPDSGIQNSPDHPSSPEPSSPPSLKSKNEDESVKTKNSHSKTKTDIKSTKSKPNSRNTKAVCPEKSSKISSEQKSVQKQKMALSCSNMDRVLYVNTDRVLYPPRRKAGRPTGKVGVRKPGRPPKYHNTIPSTEVETENVAPVSKHRNIQDKSSNAESESSKKVQSSGNQPTIKPSTKEKDDGAKKTKKSTRTLCDSDIVQLTSNTLSLSLGKSSCLKKSDANSSVSKNKSGGAILNEICERVSKRLELNNTIASPPDAVKSLEESQTKPAPTTIKKVIHNVKNIKNMTYIKNKAKLNALKTKYPTLKHMKVMHTKHKHKKHKKHKIKILKTISMPLSVPKVDTDIDKLVIDFMKLCNLGTSKAQKENLPEMFRCVKRVSKKRKGVETNEGRKKKKQCNTSTDSKEHNSNEQRLPLKKRHYHMSTNSDQKHISTPEVSSINTNIVKPEILQKDTDIKIPNKNGVITSNKSLPTGKIMNDKTKIVPSKSEAGLTDTKKEEVEVKSTVQTRPSQETVIQNANNLGNIKKHLGSEDVVGAHIDEAIEACITRYTGVKPETHPTISQPTTTTATILKTEVKTPAFGNSVTATTPKKRHRLEETKEKNEQAEKVSKKLDTALNTAEKSGNGTVIETPKSNLESVVSELKNKKSVSVTPSPTNENNKKQCDKHIETIAQMITRKKNRLEDLASNLVSKINPSSTVEASDNLLEEEQKGTDKKAKEEKNNVVSNRASVIKSPVAKKIKAVTNENLLDSVVNEKPTGIFLQTVDLELHIPATTIQTVQNVDPKSPEKVIEGNQHNLRNKKPPQEEIVETESNKTCKVKKQKILKEPVVAVEKMTTPVKSTVINDKIEVVECVTGAKKKIRRRKAINRTGFPTLKKKKKKIPVPNKILKIEIEEIPKDLESNVYDRVPRLGEEASTFMKRTNCLLSVVSLEKLQAKSETIPTIDEPDMVSKWEVFSECDSLPMDECHFPSDIDSTKSVKTERCFSRQDRMMLRVRDISPATSIETRSSDRTKKSSRNEDVKCEIKHRDSSTGSVRTSSDISEVDRKIKRKRDVSYDKTEKKCKKHLEDNLSSIAYRKRLRDLSPASSIEPLPSDKKMRSDENTSGSGDDTKRNKKVPRWRKKFLVAGLFSDYYKEDDETARAKRRENAANKTKLVYKPDEHPYGLLPPPYHCGKYLRCRKVPFQLPHDLWWQHTHAQLPGRDLVPSWNYRKIRTNVYCVRAPSGTCEPQACNCSSECEDDCINRLVLAECPASHKCQNQKIQRHEWAPGLEKFMTDSKGWGVRTKLPIKRGEFILEYVGEVVSDQEFKHRMATRYTHDTHHYCLHLDGGLVIDGHRMGGDGRFVNHSCQPNCEMQKWSVNGQFRMALFALRDISDDEELTYDYNFSLFNPADGQECKCGSNNCRGVIGGKSQRLKQCPANNQQTSTETNNNHQVGRVGRPRKNQAKKAAGGPKEAPAQTVSAPITAVPLVRPLSHQQKIFALEHHCFLLRNLNKVKRVRERSVVSVSRCQSQLTVLENNSAFLSQLNALRQPRNMRTRRLAQAEENPELNKTARLSEVLKDLLTVVTSAKDENNKPLSASFMTLPSKRKHPEYYQRITNPIDLSTIEQNIATGVYRSAEVFDAEMNKLFANSVRFFGRTSELGIAATRLRKAYGQAKMDNVMRLENVLGEKPSANFVGNGDPGGEEEDVIRCICGLYRDEGLMIQCERCLVWQHCECVLADPAAAIYHCESCVPRTVDLEIPLDEYTEQGHRYYVSLLRDDLQLRQGDTVYVLRDIPIPGTDRKHTYSTIGKVKYADLDIFRIERLWKDSKTDQRYAFGHHYLRPHETYHEPTRKFFPNEVMRVPLYEVVPVELIMSPCWVLDINTYCKGRPIGAFEEHVYICEYRVDKSARLFSKISKSKYPICTKSYAFERFDVKLKISRTYTPHELKDAVQMKPRGRKPLEERENEESTNAKDNPMPSNVPEVPIIRSREEQRAHLNGILLRLLGRLPSKQTLDVSYLLEGGRRRKKQQS